MPSALGLAPAQAPAQRLPHLMMAMMASGQLAATPSHSVFTMPALMLKRSSRVMPGLRGTPAGITTSSAPLSAPASSSAPVYPVTCTRGTPGVGPA